VPSNPAARIGLVKSFADLGRDRAPTVQELGNIWRGADVALNQVAATYMKVLILTALRREETALIRWSWLSLDGSEPLLTIPGEVTKNHQVHEVPLTPSVVELFRALPRLSNDANSFVFTSDGKRHIGGHSKNKKAMEKAMQEAGEEVADWRFHDFRRAFSSYANEHDLADTDTIEAALNHVGHKSGVRRVYDRSKRLVQRRQLMLAWTEAVTSAVERRELPANVVRIFK
jgi:integrase